MEPAFEHRLDDGVLAKPHHRAAQHGHVVRREEQTGERRGAPGAAATIVIIRADRDHGSDPGMTTGGEVAADEGVALGLWIGDHLDPGPRGRPANVVREVRLLQAVHQQAAQGVDREEHVGVEVGYERPRIESSARVVT
jgi:hypothetical protein